MDATVTLETKCWERDWRRILTTDHLCTLAELDCYSVPDTVVLVNDVEDRSAVCRHAKRALSKGWLTRVVVEDHAEETLDFLAPTRGGLGPSYVYSTAELVGIYLCRSGYLIPYSSDSLPATRCEWVPQALSMLETYGRVKVASLAWHAHEAEAQACLETPDWFIGPGFSDQCYLIHTLDFRGRIYREQHPASTGYPHYGGELFEKRVDAWMRNHDYLRITFRHGSYGSTP